MKHCLWRLYLYMLVKYSYAHEDVAYLNVIHNKILYDEGNLFIH